MYNYHTYFFHYTRVISKSGVFLTFRYSLVNRDKCAIFYIATKSMLKTTISWLIEKNQAGIIKLCNLFTFYCFYQFLKINNGAKAVKTLNYNFKNKF